MKKNKLDEILREYDEQHQPGQFTSTEEFKNRFFTAIAEERNRESQPKTTLLMIGVITAIAAAVLFILLPLTSLLDMPTVHNETKGEIVAHCDYKLMQQLKQLFPEQKVGLCLVNGELNTFNETEQTPRNILVNYLIRRTSDGKEIKLSLATGSDNFSTLKAGKVKGSVWAYQPDGKVLTVDTDLALQLDAQTTIKIQTSNLLKLNKKQLVSAFKYQGSEYQLFQSACRI